MDVVRHNLLAVGGQIKLDSSVGRSTRVRLTLPVAMSIARGLVVVVEAKRYLIPLPDVSSMIKIDPDQVHTYGDSHLLRLREGAVPLVALGSMLGSGNSSVTGLRGARAVVLLEVGGLKAGVVVDDIRDIEDIAIRPLPGDMEGLAIYAGCSIMADGMVVPVLNSAKLLASQTKNGEFAQVDTLEQAS